MSDCVSARAFYNENEPYAVEWLENLSRGGHSRRVLPIRQIRGAARVPLAGSASCLRARDMWGTAPTPFQAICSFVLSAKRLVSCMSACVPYQELAFPRKLRRRVGRSGSFFGIEQDYCRVTFWLLCALCRSLLVVAAAGGKFEQMWCYWCADIPPSRATYCPALDRSKSVRRIYDTYGTTPVRAARASYATCVCIVESSIFGGCATPEAVCHIRRTLVEA